MPDLDERVAAGLRALTDRAPVDADVWPAVEHSVAVHRRRHQAVVGGIVVALVLAVAIAAGVAVQGTSSSSRPAGPGTTSPTTQPPPLPDTGRVDGTITISATSALGFTPNEINAHTGIYAVTLVDESSGLHTLDFDDRATRWDPQRVAGAGEARTARVFFGHPGDYTFACTVPGHREAGSVGVVHVTGPVLTLAEAAARAGQSTP